MRSRRDSPPSTATYSVIDRVRPTGTPGAAERMASTALRWASTKWPLTVRRSWTSLLPGGKVPSSQPMVATMLGSLMVQARRTTSPSSPAARWQKAAKRSAVAGFSQPPWAATQRGLVKWWKVTVGSMPSASSASHWAR
jgi:hypothetical protein